MGLSRKRLSALLNLGMFCQKVVFWVGRVSQKAWEKEWQVGAGV